MYNEENAEKERERMLLRGAIKKQGTEINKLKQENEQLKSELGYTRKLNYKGNHIPRIFTKKKKSRIRKTKMGKREVRDGRICNI